MGVRRSFALHCPRLSPHSISNCQSVGFWQAVWAAVLYPSAPSQLFRRARSSLLGCRPATPQTFSQLFSMWSSH